MKRFSGIHVFMCTLRFLICYHFFRSWSSQLFSLNTATHAIFIIRSNIWSHYSIAQMGILYWLCWIWCMCSVSDRIIWLDCPVIRRNSCRRNWLISLRHGVCAKIDFSGLYQNVKFSILFVITFHQQFANSGVHNFIRPGQCHPSPKQRVLPGGLIF